jgi:hypothetical protein
MTSPLELVKRHYLNVSAANFDAEDELFSPDVETIDPGAGTLAYGSDRHETPGNHAASGQLKVFSVPSAPLTPALSPSGARENSSHLN